MTITPDRLAMLEEINLDQGSHGDFNEGHCAMEVVSWLADQGFTDAPACASRVLGRYVIALNDRWDDERRQTLKPYLPRMIGTGGDGKDELRQRVATEFLAGRLLGPWLDLAGMGDHMASLEGKSGDQLRAAIRVIRDAAWDKRRESRAELRKIVEAKVRERLAKKPDAVAAAAADPWQTSYAAAYKAAKAYYDEHPLPVMAAINDLAAKQQSLALELLDALIDPAAKA